MRPLVCLFIVCLCAPLLSVRVRGYLSKRASYLMRLFFLLFFIHHEGGGGRMSGGLSMHAGAPLPRPVQLVDGR
jgi:hypothetical protein